MTATAWCVCVTVVVLLRPPNVYADPVIVVDGVFDDWTGVPIAATDPPGDSLPFGGFVTDLLAVQLAAQGGDVFARLTYAGSPFLGVLLFNTDNNVATGGSVHGAEYALCFNSPSSPAVVAGAPSADRGLIMAR